jgi:hypothetical protein
MGQQGPVRQGLEDLGQGRAHARALAGGEDHDGEVLLIGGQPFPLARWIDQASHGAFGKFGG